MAKTKDMTVGNPTKLLIAFTLPMMLGNLFQQAYSIVDAMVVGRFVGVEALAAVGNAAWLDWLVMGIVVGLSQGFTIHMSQRFGAQDYEGLRKTVAMSVIVSAVFAVCMSAISLTFLRRILVLMNVPDNTIDMAQNYLTIVFSCTIIITAYNLIFSILRALGDSKTPLYAMVIASCVNIAGDLLLVIVFDMGVIGVAIATVFAQFCALLFCFKSFLKVRIALPKRSDWKLDFPLIRHLIGLGMPIAFQNGIIAVGGLVLQSIINQFGYIFAAGIAAGNKVCGLMEVSGIALGAASSTFTGQNLGAKKYGRIRDGIRAAAIISIVLAAIVGGVVIVFGKQILLLFLSGEPAVVQAALDASYPYIVTMSICMFMLYLLYVYRSALQGMGDTTSPMISGILELIARIAFALILPKFFAEFGIYIAEVSAWISAGIMLMAVFFYRMYKMGLYGKNRLE